jgi:hypothetical protein
MKNCDYEDCDQEGPITVRDGTHRCAYHAVVTLLVDMDVEEARRAINEGNLHIMEEQ